jgi:outer membrane lipopolysaccharide assembly protein LptE/RlpB
MRGAATLPPEMAQTYIETTDRHSVFYRKLRDGLRQAGVDVVDSPIDATAMLRIASDETGQRVLSVSARNVPTEFEVFYTVAYDVMSEEKVLLPSRTQSLTRDYIWDETRVLGKEREAEMLREALADDLVRVILIQLSGV